MRLSGHPRFAVHRIVFLVFTAKVWGLEPPVLVVTLPQGADIADGYHRVWLAYRLNPFRDVPPRIASELRKK